MNLTDDELSAIEARAAKATPGPWRVGIPYYACTAHPDGRHGDATGCTYAFTEWYVGGEHNAIHQDKDYRNEADPRESLIAGMWDWEDGGIKKPADAAFMAHARTDVPALIAEVRRLRDALRAVVLSPRLHMPVQSGEELRIEMLVRDDDVLVTLSESAWNALQDAVSGGASAAEAKR